ncbi:MAG: hypothetical protein RIF32_16220 [Leptospirales bacterium]
MFFIFACEAGNVVRKQVAPGFGPPGVNGDPDPKAILMLSVVDRSGTLATRAFDAAFHTRLTAYRPAYRFGAAPGRFPADLLADAIAAADETAGEATASYPPDRRPEGLRGRYFAVTIVHENSRRREVRTEYVGDDEHTGGAAGWREIEFTTAAFRGDFYIFAPGRAEPVFFLRYERESEDAGAEEIAQDEESAGQVCVDAFGRCLFDSALQVLSGGRADSAGDDDISRFMKAVALELPED